MCFRLPTVLLRQLKTLRRIGITSNNDLLAIKCASTHASACVLILLSGESSPNQLSLSASLCCALRCTLVPLARSLIGNLTSTIT